MTESKIRAGRPRSRRPTWRLIGFAALFLGIWLVGLLWFAKDLPVSVAAPARATDAIVVLTGGSGRVHQGLELLAQRRAKKLFISGVYRGVDVRELLGVSQQSPADLDCCIALGYEADSTRGNARETADWMREQGLGSLRLVTAAYHMPR
ncbi:MAG: YdcF family protein, partial [Proteobacteria bacterium]|nr:YdcF family protein [Pseudomonadota bacterium]